jgi:hypothetical protein
MTASWLMGQKPVPRGQQEGRNVHAVAHLAQDGVELRQRSHDYFDVFARLEVEWLGRVPRAREVKMGLLSMARGFRVRFPQEVDVARSVTGLFEELTSRRISGIFSGLDDARREFERKPEAPVPILAHEDELLAIRHTNHTCPRRTLDDVVVGDARAAAGHDVFAMHSQITALENLC